MGEKREGDCMKRKLCLIICVALCITMSAACKREEKVKEKPGKNYSVVTNMRMQVKDNGIFYLDGYEKLMKFYDYELKESIPGCDKPKL